MRISDLDDGQTIVTKEFLQQELRAQFADFRADIQRWVFTVVLGVATAQTALILGAVYFMLTHLK